MGQRSVYLIKESAIPLSLILASNRRLSEYIAFNFLLQSGVQTLRTLITRIFAYDEKILKSFTAAVALALIGIQGITFGQGAKRRVHLISSVYIFESFRILLAARDQKYWDDRIRFSRLGSLLTPVHMFDKRSDSGFLGSAVYFASFASIPALLQCSAFIEDDGKINFVENLGWTLYAVSLLWGTYDGASDLARISLIVTSLPSLSALWDNRYMNVPFKLAITAGLLM